MAIDPSNDEQVAVALLGYLSDRLTVTGVRFAETPERIGRGFDTYIYAFRLDAEGLDPAWARPLVLRLYPNANQADKAEREATAQRFVAERGFPAAAPLAIEREATGFGLPLMVLERVAGVPMLERIGANPLGIGRLFGAMADAHATLHQLPVDGCSLPCETPLVVRKLDELRPRVERMADGELSRGLRWLDEHKGVVTDEERSLCHGDFHPLNIMVADDGALTVLDWSDAAIGDRHSDVARTLVLFRVAWIAAESRVERFALRYGRGFLASRYLKPYQRKLSIDAKRLCYWQALQSFGGWLLVAELANPDNPSVAGARQDAVQRLPEGLLPELRTYFWERAKE